MQMMIAGENSYWDWARSLTTVIGKAVSKQAIFYRMNSAWLATVKAVVGKVLSIQAKKQVKHQLFASFKNVWIQDSTTLHLPEALFGLFKGKVMDGRKKSVAKLNVILNALSGVCPVMEWSGFTVSEQSLSSEILRVAKTGDLVLRDLGYFVLKVLKQLDEAKIFFLSRWQYGVKLYDAKTNKEINLLHMLRGRAWLDMEVICGSKEQLKVRLVVVKLKLEQAAERRRKAKKKKSSSTHHSAEYYALLGYVIFITNVDDKVWNYKEVAEAYRLRWNVEVLFKSWKSGFDIRRMIPDAKIKTERIESVLYLLLLYIAWFQLLVYIPLMRGLKQQSKKSISIIQLAKWAKFNTMKWLNEKMTIGMRNEIAYYCCYDTRRRMNAAVRLQQFFKPLT